MNFYGTRQMPELPEVEVTRLGLLPHLPGQTIIQAIFRTAKLRHALPAELAERLAGKRIEAIQRRGKYLIFDCSSADGRASFRDRPVDLAEGGVKLLIIRRENLDIEFQALADGEFSLLHALAGNGDFATACEQAMAAQPTLDLPACFHRHVVQGVLVDFFLPNC